MAGPSDCQCSEHEKCLCENEIVRVRRFRRGIDRVRFISIHGALRFILAKYLEIKPDCIRYTYGDFGKPMLDPSINGHGLCFNISHSGNLGAIAVANGIEVGIDIENVSYDFPYWELMPFFFSSTEQEAIYQSSSPSKSFFNLWTRKEAYIKATGEGLNMPLDSIPSFSLQKSKHHGQTCKKNWFVADIDPSTGYVGALAAMGKIKRVTFFEYTMRSIVNTSPLADMTRIKSFGFNYDASLHYT